MSCSCDTGWAGTSCGSCDAAAGYHDDGMGGCTTDACLPNPCTTPNRTVCMDAGGSASCSCDPGYHDDGVGGCTTDPCVPDPCAAMGQLCRDAGGVAECYTPTCNDDNPCTEDTFDGSACVFTPLADGTGCSTTLCVSSQTCSAGLCTGGAAVSCDDGNPCTTDSCDALAGCDNVADDALVPDDGVSCTVDVCAGGVASNTPDDGACDDGLWCNGSEVCAPSETGAGVDGCVARAAPVAPGPDGPCGSWVCDEGTASWSMDAAAAGTSCDDSVACTTGDACTGDGACRGTWTAACGGGATSSCSTTTPFGASGVDIPAARVLGELTFDGGMPVPSRYDDEVNLWLRDQSTGALVHLEQIDFSSWDGSTYALYSNDFRDDRVIDLDVLPGTYDVLYERLWNTDPA
ncbi:MAG: hypothetical protein GWN85_16885, partial [Gemmatimonadetes bacterium]|nr:hypothetical protein [Gemmatimonadota bacterium]NIR37408.1 hypothetical protein [Actinomycetota bacterium]